VSFGEQLQAFTHNKKALAGAGIAAGLGVFVLLKRRSSSSSGSGTSSTAADSGSTPYVPASTYPNSYGTDLAGALGNMDSQYATAVQGFQSQLLGVQSALASLQTSGSAVTLPDTSTYSPQYVPPGSPGSSSSGSGSSGSFGGGGSLPPSTSGGSGSGSDTGNAGSGQGGVTVPATTVSLLPAGYGWFATAGNTYTADSIARRYGISVDTLARLNPGLNIRAGSTVIGKNLPVKVRSNAAPWDLTAYRQVNHIV
jgi:LysM repeat protein